MVSSESMRWCALAIVATVTACKTETVPSPDPTRSLPSAPEHDRETATVEPTAAAQPAPTSEPAATSTPNKLARATIAVTGMR